MDCHKSLALALGLSVGALGCVHQETVPKPVTDSKVTKVTIEKGVTPIDETAKAKRKPTPALCVAFAQVAERGAEEDQRESADRDCMRSQAIKGYKKALEIDPKNLEAMRGLARVYENSGDHEQAIQTFRKATAKQPKEPCVWHDLGMCHAKHKEWDPALECLRKAADLDRDDHRYAKSLGLCLARAGRYDESFQCLKPVVGEAEAHFYVARMLKHMEQKEACLAHLQAAVQADPQLVKAHQMLEEIQNPAPNYLPASYHELELQ